MAVLQVRRGVVLHLPSPLFVALTFRLQLNRTPQPTNGRQIDTRSRIRYRCGYTCRSFFTTLICGVNSDESQWSQISVKIHVVGKWHEIRYVQWRSSIASDTPLLLLVLLAPQSTRQSHRTEHTLSRLDRDVALSCFRSSTALFALPPLLIVVM